MIVRKLAAMILILAAAVSGCEFGSLTDVNENPNAPENVPARFLLPSVLQRSAEIIFPADGWGHAWVQHHASLQYGYVDRYEMEADFSDGRWDAFWLGPAIDVQQMIDRGRESNKPNVVAVGLILKSWIFQVMTDIWGSIPYSQGLNGLNGSVEPVYTPQRQVYTVIIADLKAAQDMIDPDVPLFGSEQFITFDILYNGNMEAWRRFANSLRLRAGMHLSEIEPSKAANVIASAVEDGVIKNPLYEPTLDYSGAPSNEQPWSVHYRERLLDFRASSTMVDTLKSLNDPRLGIYHDPAVNTGEFTGKRNGTSDSHGLSPGDLSRMGSWFRRSDRPTWFMTLAEVLFLQAEAAARGWIAGDPAQFYDQGIRAAMQRVGVQEAKIDEYLNQSRITYDPARWREQIALQKWIALYDDGVEAWTEYRRTGIPVLEAGPAAVISRVPLRAPYPSSEEALNESLVAAKQRRGGDGPLVPLWWDVN